MSTKTDNLTDKLTDDKSASNKATELKGRAKEAVGTFTENDDLKRDGKADQAESDIRSAIDSVVDKARDAVDKLLGRDDSSG